MSVYRVHFDHPELPVLVHSARDANELANRLNEDLASYGKRGVIPADCSAATDLTQGTGTVYNGEQPVCTFDIERVAV
ncbi:hypothetical protein [Nonomuraea basaltis]|uniref:hypothetical protein n=1 Tax=Nonomuraea basaltis TaxID=2495887 RepID=UPI00110C687D|nr:hypothetical protein [Nonomuraea basaltis]TMR91290.1 hypothetical protein EJK15_50765 [Nonomuraea basaltis]